MEIQLLNKRLYTDEEAVEALGSRLAAETLEARLEAVCTLQYCNDNGCTDRCGGYW